MHTLSQVYRQSLDAVYELIYHADLRLFVTSVLHEEPWKYDSKVVPIPWRQNEEDSVKAKIKAGKLNIGFYETDGNVSEPLKF